MTSLVDESSLLAALEATTRTLQERGKVIEASGTLEQTLALAQTCCLGQTCHLA